MPPAQETITWLRLMHLRPYPQWQLRRLRSRRWWNHPTRLTLLRIIVRTHWPTLKAHTAELHAFPAQGPPPAKPPPRPHFEPKDGEPAATAHRRMRGVHSNIVNDACMQLPRELRAGQNIATAAFLF
jgi:hypothetical protein